MRDAVKKYFFQVDCAIINNAVYLMVVFVEVCYPPYQYNVVVVRLKIYTLYIFFHFISGSSSRYVDYKSGTFKKKSQVIRISINENESSKQSSLN